MTLIYQWLPLVCIYHVFMAAVRESCCPPAQESRSTTGVRITASRRRCCHPGV